MAIITSCIPIDNPVADKLLPMLLPSKPVSDDIAFNFGMISDFLMSKPQQPWAARMESRDPTYCGIVSPRDSFKTLMRRSSSRVLRSWEGGEGKRLPVARRVWGQRR